MNENNITKQKVMTNINQKIEFKDFFLDVQKCSREYTAKAFLDRFDLSKNVHNITNYTKFTKTINTLCKYKLNIHMPLFYDRDLIFNKYILPTAVFMHYMNINVGIMDRLHIFIVNNDIYDRYSEVIGGEYFLTKSRDKPIHMILVKDYEMRSSYNPSFNQIEKSYTTLFHELIHLHDNKDKTDFKCNRIIKYTHQRHEIKARYISKFFYNFYCNLLNGYDPEQIEIMVDDLKWFVIELDDLYSEIINIQEKLSEYIDTCIQKFELPNMNLVNENTQYLDSMDVIENIQIRFYNIIEGYD